jgi:hypothetical protein
LTPFAGYVLLTFADATTAEKAARSHHDAHVATFEDFNRESVYYPFCRQACCQETTLREISETL